MERERPGKPTQPGTLTVVGLIAALAAGVAGVALAHGYLPHSPGVDLADLQAPYRRSATLADGHRLARWLFLAAAIASAVTLGRSIGQTPPARARATAATIASALAVVAAVVTVATGDLVTWDQLAMRSIPRGEDTSGYWFAAFDADVLHVLTEGRERSQGQYRTVLLVHLAAPFAGAGALLAGLVLTARPSSPPGPRGDVGSRPHRTRTPQHR